MSSHSPATANNFISQCVNAELGPFGDNKQVFIMYNMIAVLKLH